MDGVPDVLGKWEVQHVLAVQGPQEPGCQDIQDLISKGTCDILDPQVSSRGTSRQPSLALEVPLCDHLLAVMTQAISDM